MHCAQSAWALQKPLISDCVGESGVWEVHLTGTGSEKQLPHNSFQSQVNSLTFNHSTTTAHCWCVVKNKNGFTLKIGRLGIIRWKEASYRGRLRQLSGRPRGTRTATNIGVSLHLHLSGHTRVRFLSGGCLLNINTPPGMKNI